MTISILLPIHKISPYFNECLNSIIHQTHSEFELHILANSLDIAFHEEIKKIKYYDRRIILHHIKFPGLSYALNYGLNQSKNSIIARMDGDDICHERRLEIQYNKLVNSDIDILGTNYNIIDSHGNSIGESNLPIKNNDIRGNLLKRNVIAHPSVMFLKEKIVRSGGYMTGYYPEDWDLWLRLARNEDIIFENLKENLLSYRMHDDQLSNSKVNKKNTYYQTSMLLSNALISGKIILYIQVIKNILRIIKNKLVNV